MSRKGENIYKRKDGRWEGRYIKNRTDNGKISYGYVYAKTYRETKAKLHDKKTNPAPKKENIKINPDIFEVVASEWMAANKAHIKDSTFNKYQNLLNSYILPTFGNHSLEKITHDFIETHCNKLLLSGGKKGTGLSPKTVSDVLSVIRNILKYATKKEKIVLCDGSSVQIKQVPKPMRVFSKKEQEILCRHLFLEYTPYTIGILICLFTGLRIGEVCALHWEDVSLSEKTLFVHSTLQRIQIKDEETEKKTKIVVTEPKSICSIRTIPVPDALINILIEYKETSKGYLLTNDPACFVEPRTMQNHFKKILKNTNIQDANFHALRHTFATRCVELGFDVKSLSEILGHSTVNITMNRYVHPTLEHKKENMQKLSSLLAVK